MANETTMQPFEAGDVFLGCTLLNDESDDHAGAGRILQYDQELNPKGVLWTEGGEHLVGGLAVDRSGLLWAFNDLSVLHIDPESGQQKPLSDAFLPRVYRSASFGRDGSIYLGEHMCGKEKSEAAARMTSIRFPVVPGASVLGFGNIYKYDSDWNLVQEFESETAPEFTGFKGVTHHSLHPSEEYITYTTETGKRIMRYDIVNDRQMPDLVTYPGDDLADGNWAIAVRHLDDGRLLVTRSDTMEVLDETGNVVGEYTLGSYGWTDIALCHDGAHALISNIFDGIMVKLNLDSGEIIGTIDTGQARPKRALAGVAEYPGLFPA